MKNFLSKITKDGALITAMCACIILITAAALITMYNKNRQSSDDGIVSEKQTEEETSAAEINEALVETEETEEETEKETKNIALKIETEAELAKATEKDETDNTENTEDINTEANATDEGAVDATDSEAANANAQAETEVQTEVAESSETVVDEANAVPTDETSEAVAETQANADAYTIDISLNFTDESKLVWPVSGEIIREFSMDTTVWFSTLKQYRTSDAIQIQSTAGTEVVAAATGRVTAVGENDELGNFVVMDLGNGYTATYAQLTDIIVEPGNYVTAGTSFACVAEPTYYYVVDGAHLYFKLTHDDELLDPLDYLE